MVIPTSARRSHDPLEVARADVHGYNAWFLLQARLLKPASRVERLAYENILVIFISCDGINVQINKCWGSTSHFNGESEPPCFVTPLTINGSVKP